MVRARTLHSIELGVGDKHIYCVTFVSLLAQRRPNSGQWLLERNVFAINHIFIQRKKLQQRMKTI